MSTPIVLRNRTRFPLVFRYKSPQHLAFHKVLDGGTPQTLEAGDVLAVKTDPGATWEASIPSSDFVYGSQWVQPYKFMKVDIPSNVQHGDVFDISESGFINRDPAPGGMTGPGTGAGPTQVVGPVMNATAMGAARGPDDASLMGKIQTHETAVAFAGVSVVILIILCLAWWFYQKGAF